MVKRLVVGLLLGAVVGAALAAALVQGLGVLSFDGSMLGAAGAYVAAAVTGLLTGLIAGKPIWSADGKIEAGLKGFFGALLALGAMFALRQWVHFGVDLSALQASAGPGEIGQLPAASLPLIGAVLGAFFELDNTGNAESEGVAGDKGAASKPGSKVRVGAATAADDAEDEDEAAPARRRR